MSAGIIWSVFDFNRSRYQTFERFKREWQLPFLRALLGESDREAAAGRSPQAFVSSHLENYICMASLGIYRDLERLGHPVDLAEVGALVVTKKENEEELIKGVYEEFFRASVPVWRRVFGSIAQIQESSSGQRVVSDGDLSTSVVSGSLQLLPSPSAIRAVEPALNINLATTCGKALLAPFSAHVNPTLVCDAFLDAAKELSPHHHALENVGAIVRIEWDGDRYLVDMEKSGQTLSVSTKHLVLANGAGCEDTDNLLQLKTPIVPVKGHVWVADNRSEENQTSMSPGLSRILLQNDSAAYWAAKPTLDPSTSPPTPHFATHRGGADAALTQHWYGKPLKNGESVLFGVGRLPWSSASDFSDDAPVSRNCIRDAQASIGEYLPHLQGGEGVSSVWTGVMPFPLRGSALVGSLEGLGVEGGCSKFTNIWVANGFGPKGVMMGPGTMGILAEWVWACMRTQAAVTEDDADNIQVLRKALAADDPVANGVAEA